MLSAERYFSPLGRRRERSKAGEGRDTKQFAAKLRREQTPAESRLWWHLRNRQFHGWKFRRQVPIECYIADFVGIDATPIIELDGGQHADNTARGAERSAQRVVERLWNNDVLKNTDDVLDEVYRMLHPTDMRPSP